MARELLQRPFDPEMLKLLTEWYAPGYTMLLATVIGLFGEVAAFWVNPVLAVCLGVFWVKLCGQLSGHRLVGYLALVLTAFFILQGDYANGYHALYPFRDLPAFAFLVMGLYGLYRAGVASISSSGLVFICLALGAAALIREPSVLGFLPGVFWWYRTARAEHKNLGLRRVLLGCAAFLGCMLIVYIVVQAGKEGSQIGRWIYFFKTNTADGMGAHALRQWGYLHQAIGWPGWVGVLLGCWLLRRNPPAFWFVLIPSLLFFLFHLPYTSHPRYMIKIIIYFSFPVAVAIHALLHQTLGRIPSIPSWERGRRNDFMYCRSRWWDCFSGSWGLDRGER